MAILGLDVGEKRIGVAVSAPGDTYAMPLCTLERTNIRADVAQIAQLAAEHLAAVIVVGDPLTLRGERGIASQKIDAFVTALARAFGGSIERVDERMTTAAATKTLIGANVSRKGRRAVVDQLAASHILDGYLARRRRS